jgi:hypothetical protein
MDDRILSKTDKKARAAADMPRCGLCGKTRKLTKTECCDRWNTGTVTLRHEAQHGMTTGLWNPQTGIWASAPATARNAKWGMMPRSGFGSLEFARRSVHDSSL